MNLIYVSLITILNDGFNVVINQNCIIQLNEEQYLIYAVSGEND